MIEKKYSVPNYNITEYDRSYLKKLEMYNSRISMGITIKLRIFFWKYIEYILLVQLRFTITITISHRGTTCNVVVLAGVSWATYREGV